MHRQYEEMIAIGTSILMCNCASLNMAIDMGFKGRKEQASDKADRAFHARTGQVTLLKKLIGGFMDSQSPANIAIRVTIINMLIKLLGEEEIEADDIEDCLDDFMEVHFAVIADESSHREIARTLIRVRQELVFCATNDLDLPTGSNTI